MTDWFVGFGWHFVLAMGISIAFFGWGALIIGSMFLMAGRIEEGRWVKAGLYALLALSLWIAGGLILGGW